MPTITLSDRDCQDLRAMLNDYLNEQRATGVAAAGEVKADNIEWIELLTRLRDALEAVPDPTPRRAGGGV